MLHDKNTLLLDFSIVIPVWNEVDSLDSLIQRITAVCKNCSYQLIIVDDRSTDGTYEKLKLLSHSNSFTLLSKPDHIPRGKAYSLLYGFSEANAEIVGMIDGDLQYPPEAIPILLEAIQTHGVVVGNRKQYGDSFMRKFFHTSFSTVFGRWLHGFTCDIQSGLKFFKRDILNYIDHSSISSWTFDLQLLTTARSLGYTVTEVPITFNQRANGSSKVNMLKASWEIGFHAIKLKFHPHITYQISPDDTNSMIGAGVIHAQKKLITHTTLPSHQSALQTFYPWQVISLLLLISLFGLGIIINPLMTATIFVAILSSIYFIDVIFSIYLVLRSLYLPPEITFTRDELDNLNPDDFQLYTVLCPLYKEASVLPAFIDSIEKLDWPKDKLEVLLLLEEDDADTWHAANSINLPTYMHVVLVPNSEPKTKPKACNYGLNLAHGEYLVIFDAEDRPESDQLKKAHAAFKKLPRRTACLQAKLNYYNTPQNLLTRLFAAEYSLWFDVILTGLQSINTAIPLGGTSNYFKTKFLKELNGWDPFNVTEDCDLGIRLFKHGYRTAIIDSTTYEEANSRALNWLRQRSRWIKGYLQTFLVHNRHPITFFKEHGIHAAIFQLVIGVRISFMLINPLLWIITISYFVLYEYIGPTIESFFPGPVFYMAVTSLIIGNFMYIYNYMIGCAKRDAWYLMKYVFLIPFYWLLASMAAVIAVVQLITKPHYWEKTIHGLDVQPQAAPRLSFSMSKFLERYRVLFSGSMLVAANIFAAVGNFIFSLFLGRSLPIESFGMFTVFTSLLSVILIPFNAVSTTIMHKTAYLYGKVSEPKAKAYFVKTLPSTTLIGFCLSIGWLLLLPFSLSFFHTNTVLPLLLFTPIWFFGLVIQNYGGYLQGILKFGSLGLMILVDVVVKFIWVYICLKFGYSDWIIAGLPLSLACQFLVAWYAARRGTVEQISDNESTFDFSFFVSVLLTNLSSIVFLGLDIILAEHYLSAYEAGLYSIISLTGKVMFFSSSLFLPFMIPLVAKNEGAGKTSKFTFLLLFGFTAAIVGIVILTFTQFAYVAVPLLLGTRALPAIQFLPLYLLGVGFFCLSRPIINYFQAKKENFIAFISIAVILLQFVLVKYNHADLSQFITVMFITGVIQIISLIAYYLLHPLITSSSATLNSEKLYVFTDKPAIQSSSPVSLRILIFNWRDIKHVWAGGSETYMHELAKRWAAEGHAITLFCGNDGYHPHQDMIDGINIIRKGGFYTVYIWAFLYYVFRFRNKFDAVIDIENGIPFFTPIYVRKPKFLLIYHIHQEVFRKHLVFPFSVMAEFLETEVMPLVYRNQQIVTISESSKHEILKIKISPEHKIEIITPGVDVGLYPLERKTQDPLFTYVGRLKSYKNIDVIISAFELVYRKYPKAQLYIAGSGECLAYLQRLRHQLHLERSVHFLGRISDVQKKRLLSRSWAMLQPSMIEGWGITVIEANAVGTPVIASNVNGLRDSVVHYKTGILVEPRDKKQFAEAMKLLIEDKHLRHKFSEIAFQWSKNFSWDKSADMFLTTILNRVAVPPSYAVDEIQITRATSSVYASRLVANDKEISI